MYLQRRQLQMLLCRTQLRLLQRLRRPDRPLQSHHALLVLYVGCRATAAAHIPQGPLAAV